MEAEASAFETSEMLGTFLGSTPLLLESWKLCVNNTVSSNFVVDRVGDVGYVAFSWGVDRLDLNLIVNDNNLVRVDHNGLFSSLRGYDDEDENQAPMVHTGFLTLFLSLYNSQDFQNQMLAITEQCKTIVITGHSVGGTTASLATLWLLSYLESVSSHISVLCITFGSPLLGNESLSQAILRERWGGKFCHIVSKHDIVPRLLFFTPLPYVTPQLSYEQVNKLLHHVLAHSTRTTLTTQDHSMTTSSYRPFGNYLFCSKDGEICVDNATAIARMLHLMFIDASTDFSCIDEHLAYGEVVMRVSQQFFKKRCFTQGVVHESSYEAGISLALEASGLARQEFVTKQGRECLMKARQMGRAPSLNCAALTSRLAKITPCRAQIEWYKAYCDEHDDQMGYYDTFKLWGASKRDSKVNMHRLRLANFWDGVLDMIENNELPYDFHKRAKWVNASHFYKLLVEPLDIAHYYRSAFQSTKVHYLTHGRERRYKIFDKWWKERKVSNQENCKRNKYAGLTQDSCFWAKVEEANEWVKEARAENNLQKLAQLRENIEKFELYATRLIDNKEVSKDVVAENSSYSIWLKEWKELKSQLLQIPLAFPGYLGGQSSSLTHMRM